jgi:hypothetical protein
VKNFLTGPTKKRLIEELRQILYAHPKYRGDSQNVQNKFAFRQRPQRGIIVNNASADRVRLSADNYVGRLSSFVMQAMVGDHAGTSVEWVMENKSLLEQYSPSRDVFPSPPGVYLIEVKTVPDDARNVPGTFSMQPVLTVSDELLLIFGQEAQLSRQGLYDGALRLWVDGRHPLTAGVDYTVDYAEGLITFLKTVPPGIDILADYRYVLPAQDPLYFRTDAADYEAIPGAILAFGDRHVAGDKLAVVVGQTRADTAEVYGGKFEVNFELVLFSKDPEDRERLVDYVVASILDRQNQLGFDGLELLDVSPGGETEEVYVAEIDDYYYDGAVSVGIRVDWEVYKPLPVEVFRIDTVSKKAAGVPSDILGGDPESDLVQVKSKKWEMAGIAAVGRRKLTYERVR